jgi:twinkle protein
MNCKYIFLDHISIIVSAQGAGDERKAIDEIMTKLRMLVQETDIALLLVSHLRRPEGTRS